MLLIEGYMGQMPPVGGMLALLTPPSTPPLSLFLSINNPPRCYALCQKSSGWICLLILY